MDKLTENILNRLTKLEKNSHPPINWEELIHSNIERIDKLEVDSSEFIEIIKHLVEEKKDLQKRLDVLEDVLHSYLPVIEKTKKQNNKEK